MFTISFKAIDDFDVIKQLSAEQFDHTKQDIEGLIELNFNGSKYGLYFEDCPFGNERLLRWFTDLLTIAQKIRMDKYVAYRIPDSANLWLEFIRQGDELQVSLIEDIDRDVILDLFITEPLEEFRYSTWKGIFVSEVNFSEEIIANTHRLLNFVAELNPDILKSKSVQVLREKLTDLEQSTS